MQLVGIRDLKNRLTHYLETAKKGDAIIITDRGVPVAILHKSRSDRGKCRSRGTTGFSCEARIPDLAKKGTDISTR